MSARDKALELIADKRIQLVRPESDAFIHTYRVIGDTDPFTPYTVSITYDGSTLVESCTCPSGEFHPIRGRCSHVQAARFIDSAIGGVRRK